MKDRCFSVEEWMGWLKGSLDPAKMEAMFMHSDCEKCAEIIQMLHSPEITLGRPTWGADLVYQKHEADRFEKIIEAVITAVLEKLPTGRLVVSAGWMSEGVLLTVVSIAFSRLRERGLSAIHLPMQSLNMRLELPTSEVAAVLDATAFPQVPAYQGVLVLSGLAEDWHRLGIVEDLPVVWPEMAKLLETEADPHVRMFRARLQQDNKLLRAGIVLNAFGCDLPLEFIPKGKIPELFVQAGAYRESDGGGYSVEGQWLAWKAVESLVIEKPELISLGVTEAEARLVELGEIGLETLERFRFRRHLREF